MLLFITASAVSQCYVIAQNTEFSLNKEDQDKFFNPSPNLVVFMLIIRLA